MKQPLHVDVRLKPEEAARAMGGKLHGNPSAPIQGIALDTRAIKKGDLFFALRAARDGHEFVAESLAKGAWGAVVERLPKEKGLYIQVAETTVALRDLARSVREKWGGAVIAISGTNGKTTTKEMTAGVLSAAKKAHKTPGTWNNQLGVPLTLFLLRPEHEVAVLEMGMSDFGELTILADCAKPTVAILTNVGPAHLEKLKTLDGVAKAKGELFHALPADGIAVVNNDDERIRAIAEDLRVRKVTVSMKGDADVCVPSLTSRGANGFQMRLRYGKEEIELSTPFIGEHNVSNLLCAFGAARALDVPAEVLQGGIDRIELPEMRLERIKLRDGICLLNDCYNANPASTATALEVARHLAVGRLLLVLGDMMELGDLAPRAHRDIGIHVGRIPSARLYCLGQFGGDIAQGAIQGGMPESRILVGKTHDELAQAVLDAVEARDTILVKGSRGMKMEKVSEILTERLAEGKN